MTRAFIVDLQPFRCNVKGRLFDPPFGGWGYVVGRGYARSMARPWALISSPLTHLIYLLPFLSYLAGSKGVPVSPSVADTMTNAALEAIASSSGKKNSYVDISVMLAFR